MFNTIVNIILVVIIIVILILGSTAVALILKRKPSENENTLNLCREDSRIEFKTLELKGKKLSDADAETVTVIVTVAEAVEAAETETVKEAEALAITETEAENQLNAINDKPLVGMAKFNFVPQSSDELELNINDKVFVSKLFKDTWAYGTNQSSNSIGFFPLDFIILDSNSVSQPPALKKIHSLRLQSDSQVPLARRNSSLIATSLARNSSLFDSQLSNFISSIDVMESNKNV